MSSAWGSAPNSSHAVSDLRKLAGIEAYAPTDYVSELTARQVTEAIPDRPISFEGFADEFDEMEFQALEIASWRE